MNSPRQAKEEVTPTISNHSGLAYRVTDQPTQRKVREEIRLLDQIREDVERHVPPSLPASERHRRTTDLLAEDDHLRTLVARLKRISESHDGAVTPELAKLGEEEARRKLPD